MRIVAGTHKGRTLAALEGRDVRPTSDRVRESLFNILEHRGWGAGGTSPLHGAQVLDAFCGTGAMGLEALSRGAAHASFMDNARAALAVCRENVTKLGERGRCDILQGDCLRPVRPRTPCDLLFLDPPYGDGIAVSALEALAGAGWAADGALCVVETAAKDEIDPPAGFELLDSRKYGAARITILRRGG